LKEPSLLGPGRLGGRWALCHEGCQGGCLSLTKSSEGGDSASWELKMSQKSNIKKPLKQRETIDTEETGIKNPFQLVLARNFSWQSSA
jgi:hypothetical protein